MSSELANTCDRSWRDLGPREYVGRLPWWLHRVKQGGDVLAPGDPSRFIQPIDVRDVADFAPVPAEMPEGTAHVRAQAHL
jgi:hypothetical protein